MRIFIKPQTERPNTILIKQQPGKPRKHFFQNNIFTKMFINYKVNTQNLVVYVTEKKTRNKQLSLELQA